MSKTLTITPRGLDTRQASEYLGVSEIALRMGRCDGPRHGRMQPPPFCKVGRKILYLRDDLDRWLEAHRVDMVDSE